MKKIFYTLNLISVMAYAEQTISTPKPLFFEDNPQKINQLPEFAKNPQNSTARSAEIIAPVANVHHNLTQLEALINQTLVEKRWAELENYLAQYAKQPQIDMTLWRYAKGALLREQGKLPEAIALYSQIVAENPPLAYPRFDLGVMLFENKQYQQAKAELTQALPQLSPPMQRLSLRYLAETEERQSWQPSVSMQYVRTSNVNNASSEREIYLGEMRFLKDEDSLPQSAQGISYDFSLSRERNLGGNHFAQFNASYNGIYYWDNQDYNEQTLYFSLGYANKNAKKMWTVLPFFSQNWLGSPRYSQNYGASLRYDQRLNAKWQWVNSYTYYQKRYAENRTAQRHDGFVNSISTGLRWSLSPNWSLFASLDANYDHSKDRAEGSHRLGMTAGVIYANQSWGVRLNLRYAKRLFHGDNFYTQYRRIDHAQQANVALWHNTLQWKGFVPKLNYRYQRINSNIPQFYSRQSSDWFITVEKDF